MPIEPDMSMVPGLQGGQEMIPSSPEIVDPLLGKILHELAGVARLRNSRLNLDAQRFLHAMGDKEAAQNLYEALGTKDELGKENLARELAPLDLPDSPEANRHRTLRAFGMFDTLLSISPEHAARFFFLLANGQEYNSANKVDPITLALARKVLRTETMAKMSMARTTAMEKLRNSPSEVDQLCVRYAETQNMQESTAQLDREASSLFASLLKRGRIIEAAHLTEIVPPTEINNLNEFIAQLDPETSNFFASLLKDDKGQPLTEISPTTLAEVFAKKFAPNYVGEDAIAVACAIAPINPGKALLLYDSVDRGYTALAVAQEARARDIGDAREYQNIMPQAMHLWANRALALAPILAALPQEYNLFKRQRVLEIMYQDTSWHAPHILFREAVTTILRSIAATAPNETESFLRELSMMRDTHAYSTGENLPQIQNARLVVAADLPQGVREAFPLLPAQEQQPTGPLIVDADPGRRALPQG